jgi:hypothetical protein
VGRAQHGRRERLGVERAAAVEALVEHDPERPDIRASIDVLARLHLLQRHVPGRPHHGVGPRQHARAANRRLGDPEIEHLHQRRSVGTPGQEQVARLDVAVHDAERMRLGERLASLEHVVDDLPWRQRAATSELA